MPRNKRAAQALTNGKADAAFVSAEDAEQLVARGGYRQLFQWGQLYPDGRVERVIAARCEVVEKRPEEIKNFLKGMVRAYRLINDWRVNEDFLKPAWDGIVSSVGDERLSAAGGENYKTIHLTPDGTVPAKAMATALQEQKELGNADKGLQLSSILKLRPVEDAVRELKQAGISYH